MSILFETYNVLKTTQNTVVCKSTLTPLFGGGTLAPKSLPEELLESEPEDTIRNKMLTLLDMKIHMN